MKNCRVSYAAAWEKTRADEEGFPAPPQLCAAVGGHDGARVILRPFEDGEFSVEQTGGPAAELYIENYAEVTRPTRNNRYIHPLGFYPDALIPVKYAKQAGACRLEKGKSSSFYVDFHAEEAGEGELAFLVKACGGEQTIRIPYTVYPVSAAKASMQTLFLVRKGLIADGEGYCDAALYRKYFEFLLGYRINAYSLPLETKDPRELADEAERYFDHPFFKGYGLTSGVRGGGGIFDTELLKRQIFELASRSHPGHNLLEKALIKHGDEPDYLNNTAALIGEEENILAALRSAAEEIGRGDFASFKSIPDWRASVERMTLVVPMALKKSVPEALLEPEGNTAKLLSLVNAWCFKPDVYDTDMRHVAMRLREKLRPDRAAWWYTCNDPVYPYPSYHIDDNLLGARLMSWMQRRDGVEGNLMWSPVAFTNKCRPLWTTKLGVPYRNGGAGAPAGEGFLVYPGRIIGKDGPFPSLRLMNIRDGMEEYELLGAYEEKYGRQEAEKLYRRVLYGTKYYEDGGFGAARRALLEGLAGDLQPLPRHSFAALCDLTEKCAPYLDVSEGAEVSFGGGLKMDLVKPETEPDVQFIAGAAIGCGAWGGPFDITGKILRITLENAGKEPFGVIVALYGKRSYLPAFEALLFPGESSFEIFGYGMDWSEKNSIAAIGVQADGNKLRKFSVILKKIEITDDMREVDHEK